MHDPSLDASAASPQKVLARAAAKVVCEHHWHTMHVWKHALQVAILLIVASQPLQVGTGIARCGFDHMSSWYVLCQYPHYLLGSSTANSRALVVFVWCVMSLFGTIRGATRIVPVWKWESSGLVATRCFDCRSALQRSHSNTPMISHGRPTTPMQST